MELESFEKFTLLLTQYRNEHKCLAKVLARGMSWHGYAMSVGWVLGTYHVAVCFADHAKDWKGILPSRTIRVNRISHQVLLYSATSWWCASIKVAEPWFHNYIPKPPVQEYHGHQLPSLEFNARRSDKTTGNKEHKNRMRLAGKFCARYNARHLTTLS